MSTVLEDTELDLRSALNALGVLVHDARRNRARGGLNSRNNDYADWEFAILANKEETNLTATHTDGTKVEVFYRTSTGLWSLTIPSGTEAYGWLEEQVQGWHTLTLEQLGAFYRSQCDLSRKEQALHLHRAVAVEIALKWIADLNRWNKL